MVKQLDFEVGAEWPFTSEQIDKTSGTRSTCSNALEMSCVNSTIRIEGLNDPNEMERGGQTYSFLLPTSTSASASAAVTKGWMSRIPRSQILPGIILLLLLSTIGLIVMSYSYHAGVEQCQMDLDDMNATVENLKSNFNKFADEKDEEIHDLTLQKLQREGELSKFKTLYYGNEEWDSKLHIAAQEKDSPLVKGLVQNGSDVNARNKLLETPLHKAAYDIHQDYVDYQAAMDIINYLITMDTDVFAKDNSNRTFLHLLICDGTTLKPIDFRQIAVLLISQNQTELFDVPGWEPGITPFQAAVCELEVEEDTLSLLHGNGVNFNAVENDGYSVLTYAILGNRSTALISNLIKLGADWKHKNNNNESLLVDGVMKGNLDTVRFLLSLGLDVNEVDGDGDTPLHVAVRLGEKNVLETVRLLISSGANVNVANKEGLTPFREALKRDDLQDKHEIVQLLKVGKA